MVASFSDITGYQFGQDRPPVVVAEDRSWHDYQLGEPGRYPFDEVFGHLAENWKLQLDRSYAEVMKNIDTQWCTRHYAAIAASLTFA